MNKNKTITICLAIILSVIFFSNNLTSASEFTGTISSTSTSSSSQTGGTVGDGSGGNNSAGSNFTGSVTGQSQESSVGGTVTTGSGNSNVPIVTNTNPNTGSVAGASTIDNNTGSGSSYLFNPSGSTQIKENTNPDELAINTNQASLGTKVNIPLPFTASVSGAFESFGIGFWFWIILLLLLLMAVTYYIYEENKEEKSVNK
ncbi:MAG: hypothetical protein A2312_01250 [Candidatus Staskawiczbacteria bacterium RIFOXYB2_FULL_32_9]|nr:MAG: Cysteine proteinase [Parcubacteria group bacterium GW2011_GWC2_32_10]OGZ78369.1 MAG: hypothetical protein A2360_03560 [Candidatus Staskawiczbacteria bacterium RIFOXYB1_FULL_32_11]OGZ80741.1 MAG: hypothetical protein A2256_02050 [Candidatus Staskawiczbacteria bacterium RIFOXYA2_FULL_32_7]OGZ81342.1 MAG: hypothetical protein A2312_01250 [Candidatus Staskawiczbacteria bacterium RIFOXYB2_FULL_32_9]OGZ86731.1 MAG: hypothetical protein A2463_03795 [Candidatus Staskawiczbacteria bacterium RIFO